MPNSRNIIETDRLSVRFLSEENVAAVASIWADPIVTRFMGGPRDLQKVLASLSEDLAASTNEKFDLWPVHERSSDRVIGHCGLLPKEIDGQNEIELIYVLAADAWGMGYATEVSRAIIIHARQQLGCSRLVALVDSANQASAKVAVKLGMRLERETVRPGGRRMQVYGLAV
jgi:ribosomal-protein-alanine N-acetyltransferase